MQQHAASGECTSPPRRIFYGWWIVGIGCLQEAVKSGTFHTGFTLYFLPVLTEWHLSRAATSLPFSLAKLEAALAGPLVGYLIDRFDLRVTMALGTVLAGVGFLLLAATQRYATFLLVFLSLLSVGFHMGFNQGSMAAVNYWFRARRSFAMSLLQTGQALGGVLLFPLVALAVLKLGWRAAALLSGGAVLLLLPLVGFMRPTPERMGLRPDGAPPSPPAGPGRAAPPRRPARRREDWTLREACQTRAFWRVAGFHALRNVPAGGVTVHLVPLLVWKGVDPTTAAFFVGLMACSAVVVRPLTGWLGDRWAKPQIAALGVLLGACGLGILLYGPGTRGHLILKWLRVFRCAVATRRGLGVRQARQTSVVRSEKCVACRGSTQDGMRLIPACFAHVLQRWIRRVYMRFLLILQEVRSIGKTRNQLILKPIDLAKGNHKLFMEVNNRGGKLFGSLNLSSGGNNPTTAAHAGEAFLMNQGYTLAWNGWDPSAPAGGDNLTITLPVAKNPDGSSITGPSYEYIIFDNATTVTSTLAYPAAGLDKSKAMLTVRDHLNETPVVIPDSGWEYASDQAIRLLPVGTSFKQSAIYEFTYTAKDPVVAAIGFAATRDFVSFLRNATADSANTRNPLAGDIKRTLAFTVSQPGRYMNDFVWLGFNEDESERRIFDGVENWIAGGDGVALNYRFAQPARTERNRQGSCWIPGSYTPCTGLKRLILNGFFQRCRIGHDPRGKPVKTSYYAKLDQLRPWNPI